VTLGKTELLNAIAPLNRGLGNTPSDRAAALAAVANLEDRNPTPRPTEAPELLNGDWRLLYTTSRGILSINRPPLLRLGEVYQCIRTADATLYNVAEVNPQLGWFAGLVAVAARFEVVSTCRVRVRFERSTLGLQNLLDYNAPQSLITRYQNADALRALNLRFNPDQQQGWLDITYLDADLRIGRGNEGSIFVLTRTPDLRQPVPGIA
jgi:hypothetical protein